MSFRYLERPLRLGEIFDRAVTISVRGFLPLFAIFALYFMPGDMLALFGTKEISHFVADLGAFGNAHAHDVSPVVDQPSSALIQNVIPFVDIFLQSLLAGAFVSAVMRAVAGQRIQPILAYRAAFARSFQLLGVSVFFVLTIGVAFLIGAALFAQVRHEVAHGNYVAAFIIVLCELVLGGSLICCFMITSLAVNTVVLQNENVFRAIGEVRALIFRRREFARMIVVGLAILAISLIALIGGDILGQLIYELVPLFFVYKIVGSVVWAAGSIVPSVAATIYYLDLLLRRDGRNLLDERNGFQEGLSPASENF